MTVGRISQNRRVTESEASISPRVAVACIADYLLERGRMAAMVGGAMC